MDGLRLAKIVGTASETTWSQVLVFPELKVGDALAKEQLLAAIAVRRTSEGVDVGAVGRAILATLQEDYFAASSDDVGVRLEEVVAAALEGNEVEVDLAVGILKDQRGTFVSYRGGVLMWRRAEVGWIIPVKNELPHNPAVDMRVGEMQFGDKVVLGTAALFAKIDDEGMAEALQSQGIEQIGEALSSELHGGDSSEGAAAVVLEYVVVETADEELLIQAEDELETGHDGGPWGMVRGAVTSMGGVLGSRFAQNRGWRRWRQKLLGTRQVNTGASRRTSDEPAIYLKKGKNRRLSLSIAVVLLLLLSVSVGLGWRKRVVEKREAAFGEVFTPAEQRYTEAVGLAESNPLRARSLLIEARDLLMKGTEAFDEGSSERDRLLELTTSVQDLYQQVAGEYEIAEAALFFDLGLVRDDLFGEQMGLADGQLVVLDKARGVVVGVDVGSKKARILGGGDVLSQSELLGVTTGKAVVLSKSGIVGVYFGDRESEVLVEREDDWDDPKSLGTYGGNVYLLDAGNSELWRYPGFEGGVGGRRRWLGPGVVPDFSRVTDLVVDGDMWILERDGEISRYRRGAPLNFSVVGLDTDMSEAVAIDTTLEGDELYILDRGNARVVVVTKNGEYKQQYRWEGISGVTDIVVVDEEEQRKVLLLSGASIYEIPLR